MAKDCFEKRFGWKSLDGFGRSQPDHLSPPASERNVQERFSAERLGFAAEKAGDEPVGDGRIEDHEICLLALELVNSPHPNRGGEGGRLGKLPDEPHPSAVRTHDGK